MWNLEKGNNYQGWNNRAVEIGSAWESQGSRIPAFQDLRRYCHEKRNGSINRAICRLDIVEVDIGRTVNVRRQLWKAGFYHLKSNWEFFCVLRNWWRRNDINWKALGGGKDWERESYTSTRAA